MILAGVTHTNGRSMFNLEGVAMPDQPPRRRIKIQFSPDVPSVARKRRKIRSY